MVNGRDSEQLNRGSKGEVLELSMSESDNSDDWATDDLPDLPVATKVVPTTTGADQQQMNDCDDDGWARKLPPSPVVDASTEQQQEEGEPMIIVDLTALSQADKSLPEIHSKFDANSVNDPDAVKKLRVAIETNYERYARNADWLADRTVIPCGSTVWRPALARLRQERPGHYFCPIFPLNK